MSTETIQYLLGVQAFVTLFMVGLIWFVQIVHYPLFAFVPKTEFIAYEKRHTQRTSWVVVAPMLVEFTLALLLAWSPGGLLAWSGLGLLGVIWLSTATLQVPMHQRLKSGFDPSSHQRLVLSNWLRTIAWTLRGVIALLMLASN